MMLSKVEIWLGRTAIVPNALRLCVCLPLAQSFNLQQMLMGQIAQNRCYTLPFLYLKNICLKKFVYSKNNCIFVNEIKNKTLCFTLEHHYTGMNLMFAMKSQTK